MTKVLVQFRSMVVEATAEKLILTLNSDKAQKELLRGYLGETVVSSHCVRKKTDDTFTLTWKDGSLRITHNMFDDNVHRYDVVWISDKPSKLVDVFEMTGAHWFGGAQVRKMMWPLEKGRFKMAPFVAGDSYKSNEYGGVQERYWISSNGIAIFVNQDVPLHVGINDTGNQQLRLQTKFDGPYRNVNRSKLSLRYSIYHGPDIMSTHLFVSKQMIPRPISIPDPTMIRLPVWSTWALCKNEIDQEKVIKLADQILSFGIRTSQLEIDDNWAVHRGDWEWDRKKFPNPREMVRRLVELGYRVTVWVHPFSNLKSESIHQTELFVKGMARGFIKWWNGVGRVIDITNPDVVAWYTKQLTHLKENYGLTSFKFDGGETNWLPNKWSLHKTSSNPNTYTKKYAELAYELDKDWKCQEVRVGVQTQHLPIFVRMMDKDSIWEEKNGLRSIIPTALLYGIIGYPFFIPDMIGGNAYDEDRPTRSLFIRWVQVCTFMPCIQFSIPPWWFDALTVRITKKMLILRSKYTELLVKLAKEATKTGAPIIRPLWWVAPDDEFALRSDDQFLVGNDLMVAPVVTRGARSRPIYLPHGEWRDQKSGKIYDGQQWIYEYKVTLEDLPHFARVIKEIEETDKGAKKDAIEQETLIMAGFTDTKTDAEALKAEVQETKVDAEEMVQTTTETPEESKPDYEILKEIFDVIALERQTEAAAAAANDSVPKEKDAAEDVSQNKDEREEVEEEEDAAQEDEATSEPQGNRMSLLRQKLDTDIADRDTDVEEAFVSLIRGKYRFSQLDEDVDVDELPSDMSDIISVDSFDMSDGLEAALASTGPTENEPQAPQEPAEEIKEPVHKELQQPKESAQTEPEILKEPSKTGLKEQASSESAEKEQQTPQEHVQSKTETPQKVVPMETHMPVSEDCQIPPEPVENKPQSSQELAEGEPSVPKEPTQTESTTTASTKVEPETQSLLQPTNALDDIIPLYTPTDEVHVDSTSALSDTIQQHMPKDEVDSTSALDDMIPPPTPFTEGPAPDNSAAILYENVILVSGADDSDSPFYENVTIPPEPPTKAQEDPDNVTIPPKPPTRALPPKPPTRAQEDTDNVTIPPEPPTRAQEDPDNVTIPPKPPTRAQEDPDNVTIPPKPPTKTQEDPDNVTIPLEPPTRAQEDPDNVTIPPEPPTKAQEEPDKKVMTQKDTPKPPVGDNTDTPPVLAPKPVPKRPIRKPAPPPVTPSLTLWDELTAKLKNRPKFDIEPEKHRAPAADKDKETGEPANRSSRSLSTQTSIVLESHEIVEKLSKDNTHSQNTKETGETETTSTA